MPDVKPGHGLTRVLSFPSPSGWRDQMAFCIGRRAFIKLLGGAAAWPVVARAQQSAMPVIAFLRSTPLGAATHLVSAFNQGLREAGFVDGQNVAVEYYSAEGRPSQLPALLAEIMRRPITVIAA